MSGLYNALFGQNEKADILLGMLGLTRGDCGRFRDVYLNNGHIVVHTRNGGGNREYYQDVFDDLAMHPLYSYDEDDDFDCTYADIYFKYPEDHADALKELEKEQGPTPAEKWQNLFTAMNVAAQQRNR